MLLFEKRTIPMGYGVYPVFLGSIHSETIILLIVLQYSSKSRKNYYMCVSERHFIIYIYIYIVLIRIGSVVSRMCV